MWEALVILWAIGLVIGVAFMVGAWIVNNNWEKGK